MTSLLVVKRSDSELLHICAGMNAEEIAARLQEGHAFDVQPLLVLTGLGGMLPHLQISNHIRCGWDNLSASELTRVLHQAISLKVQECMATTIDTEIVSIAPETQSEYPNNTLEKPLPWRGLQQSTKEDYPVGEAVAEGSTLTRYVDEITYNGTESAWDSVEICGPGDADKTNVVRKALVQNCGSCHAKAFLSEFNSTVLSARNGEGYRRVFVQKGSKSNALRVRSLAE